MKYLNMKKIIVLFILVFLFSGCASEEKTDLSSIDIETKGYRQIDFDLPESWSKNPWDNDVAYFGPLPGKDNIELDEPNITIGVLDEGKGDENAVKNLVNDELEFQIEVFPDLNPRLSEHDVGNTKIYYIEKDPDFFKESCELGVTYIYFSKEENLYSIMMHCASALDHLDMVETIIDTIKLE